ncbi:RloB family protein [Pseudoalteromonas sp. MMG007]|uniref:RloB family protein n=1 Tax=Pseudoalteromonas sp. MMG007 TaxID=2822684 RepID=UPI001B38C070|nr:RloB family protein [Pseudoalteromonas sp. MMG007]MBQ4858488.1 RloB domain-containing protein [Pseudoalteromonas sp. MMG007]
MGRNFRQARSIKRKAGSIQPKIKIVAFCEGKNTEPDFINGFSKLHGNGLVFVECVRAAGVPMTLVDACSEKVKKLNKLAKKSDDPLDKNFQVWGVFDRDEHPNVAAAFDKARANDVRVAFSNPCFELWPYLHYKMQSADIHRKEMQKKLEPLMKSYDSNNSKVVCPFELDLAGDYEEAKARSIKLRQNHQQVGIEEIEQNPSTNVYELFDLIIENGKKKTSC